MIIDIVDVDISDISMYLEIIGISCNNIFIVSIKLILILPMPIDKIKTIILGVVLSIGLTGCQGKITDVSPNKNNECTKAYRFAFCISLTNIILRIITEKIVIQNSYFCAN